MYRTTDRLRRRKCFILCHVKEFDTLLTAVTVLPQIRWVPFFFNLALHETIHQSHFSKRVVIYSFKELHLSDFLYQTVYLSESWAEYFPVE